MNNPDALGFFATGIFFTGIVASSYLLFGFFMLLITICLFPFVLESNVPR